MASRPARPNARLCLAAVTAVASLLVCVPAEADACHDVLQSRVAACTRSCVERAKAAVDPEIRDRVLGYGCRNNCMKNEMFNGPTCP